MYLPRALKYLTQIPNWGQQPDKTFDIRLTDSTSVHDVYLTQLVFDSTHGSHVGGSPSTQSFAPSPPPEAAANGNNFATGTAAASLTANDVGLFPVVFLVAGCVVVTLLVVLAVAYVFRETTLKQTKSVDIFTPKADCDPAVANSNASVAAPRATMSVYDVDSVPSSNVPIGKNHKTGIRRTRQWRRNRTLITGLYFAFWGIYSVVFTFTAVSLMIAALAGSGPGSRLWASTLSNADRDVTVPAAGKRSIAGVIRAVSRNVSLQLAESVERHRMAESERIQRAVTGARRACSDVYVGELFAGVAAEIDRVITATGEGAVTLESYAGGGSVGTVRDTVGGMTLRRARRLINTYRDRVEAFSSAYRRNVSTAISGTVTAYRKYLRKTMTGDWTAFPRRLFNESTAEVRGAGTGGEAKAPTSMKGQVRAYQPTSPTGEDLLGEEAFFGAFIEIEEIENVQLWSQQFWERSGN